MYETFYYLWVERFFDIRREWHNLFILAFSSTHPPSRATPAQGLREQAKVNRLVQCPVLNSTNWLFQNLPKSSARFWCVTSFALCSPVFHLGLLWHFWVTRPAPPACVWTPVLMLHLSNPCTEPKGSQTNYTQRHKTKSLGHYIIPWYGEKNVQKTLNIEFWITSTRGVKICDHFSENWSSYSIMKCNQFF